MEIDKNSSELCLSFEQKIKNVYRPLHSNLLFEVYSSLYRICLTILVCCLKTQVAVFLFFVTFPWWKVTKDQVQPKLPTLITKKRNWLLLLRIKIYRNAVFCDPPFSAHPANIGDTRWKGRTHPRRLDNPTHWLGVTIKWFFMEFYNRT